MEFFQRKYRHSPVEIIAGKRIKTAAWYAGLVGFGSGIVISVSSLAALTSAVGTAFTGLVGSPITVPTLAVSVPKGLIALTIEVGLPIRIQLHLALRR